MTKWFFSILRSDNIADEDVTEASHSSHIFTDHRFRRDIYHKDQTESVFISFSEHKHKAV